MIFKKQELYEQKEFLEQAKEFFNNQAQIQLQDFFQGEEFDEFITKLIQSNDLFEKKSNPLIFSYEILNQTKAPILIQNGIEYFKSKQFQDYVEKLLGFDLELKEFEISKFKHKSFELIHDSKIANSMLIDVYFFISKDSFEDNFGGYKTYTTFDEELFYLTPEHNTLTCVFRDDEMRQYTKYINCLAKDKEYIQVKTVFEIGENLTDDLI